MTRKIREVWTEEEIDKLLELKEIEEMEWSEISKHFFNRTEYSLIKKYYRFLKSGSKKDKRFSEKPKFIDNPELVDNFKQNYENNMSKKNLQKKYKIKSNFIYYKLIEKWNLKRK